MFQMTMIAGNKIYSFSWPEFGNPTMSCDFIPEYRLLPISSKADQKKTTETSAQPLFVTLFLLEAFITHQSGTYRFFP